MKLPTENKTAPYAPFELAYLEVLKRFLLKLRAGKTSTNRTDTDTVREFGVMIKHNLAKHGFPLLRSKSIHVKSVMEELKWFLSGSTNIQSLKEAGVRIWDEWQGALILERQVELVKIRPPELTEYYTGLLSHKAKDSEHKGLSSTWSGMMKRCYDSNAHNFEFYGGKGVTVSSQWHKYENFEADAKHLIGWDFKEKYWNQFELDKDFYGASQYSASTCRWVHTSENNKNGGRAIKVTDMEGIETIYLSINDVEKGIGMSSSSVHRAIHSEEAIPNTAKQGNRKFIGWTIESAEPTEGYVYRYAKADFREVGPAYGYQWRRFADHIDQIEMLIDSLIENPMSRRHIVTAWNPEDTAKQNLPPCHLLFQCHVQADDMGVHRVHMTMYQRSADWFLGVPFNIASYAALLMLIVEECNQRNRRTLYVAEELTMFFADAHLYVNHEDQARLQLHNAIMPPMGNVLPSLILELLPHPQSLSLSQFDYEVTNYNPYPAIKAKVAV